MNRIVSPLLAAVFLAASAGLALAANTAAQPAAAQPSAAVPHQNRAQGDRMTSALNLLEAQGYGSFSNFKQDGQNYAATVKQNGQSFGVVINPDSGQVTRQG